MSEPPVAAPGGFDLHNPIGRGASSVVWEAVQLSTGRPVALKVLEVDLSGTDTRRRFDRERALMVSLAGHPGVLTVLDAGIHRHPPGSPSSSAAAGHWPPTAAVRGVGLHRRRTHQRPVGSWARPRPSLARSGGLP